VIESRASLDVSLALWAGCGGMSLTGCGDSQPSPAPSPVARAMADWSAELAAQTSVWGDAVQVDGPALLGERAAVHRFGPCACGGSTGHDSVGGAARFVRVADGWIVLNLPRPEDIDSLPALVGEDVDAANWPAVSAALSRLGSSEIIERGTLLGMAVAGLNEPQPPPAVIEFGAGVSRRIVDRPLVVDMSALWAGPLVGSLMLRAGALVVKVESTTRPDGARLGHRDFFDLLNGGKRCVSLDFSDRDDIRLLRGLLGSADLVIESSRPRALLQMGVVAEEFIAAGVSWLSITGHGRGRHNGMRVGFGDDAAVAGGLCVPGRLPMFVGDAVADPMTGLRGAVEAAAMLGSDRSSGIDLPLAGVAAAVAKSDLAELSPSAADVVRVDGQWMVMISGEKVPVSPPVARRSNVRAEPVGAHNVSVRTAEAKRSEYRSVW